MPEIAAQAEAQAWHGGISGIRQGIVGDLFIAAAQIPFETDRIGGVERCADGDAPECGQGVADVHDMDSGELATGSAPDHAVAMTGVKSPQSASIELQLA